MPRIARRLAAVLIAAPLALSGCSSSGESPTPHVASATFGALTAGQSVDRDLFFKVTTAAAEKDKTYAFTFDLGEGGKVLKATGQADNTDANNPKRQMAGKGLTVGDLEMVVADGQLYVRVAGQNGGKWVKGPMSARFEQLLRDTAARTSTDADIASSVTYVGEEEVGGEKLRHFAVYVDEAKAKAKVATPGVSTPATPVTTAASQTPASSVPSSAPPATPAPATTTPAGPRIDYWLDSSNRARKRVMMSQGQPATITYQKWGEPVTITIPPADQVIDVPGTAPTTTAVPTTSAAPPTS